MSFLQNPKIDNFATDGLTGVPGSLAYRAHEVDRHIHAWENWLGAAVTPSGETHVADLWGSTTQTAFTLTSGTDAYGAWVQIVGSADTPLIVGNVKYDFGSIQITGWNTNSTEHVIELACADSAALATTDSGNNQTTKIPFKTGLGNTILSSQMIKMRRCDVGDKVWARVISFGETGKTVGVIAGIHEYEG